MNEYTVYESENIRKKDLQLISINSKIIIVSDFISTNLLRLVDISSLKRPLVGHAKFLYKLVLA